MRGRFTLLALLGSTALIGGALAGQAVLAQPATGTVTGRVMWGACIRGVPLPATPDQQGQQPQPAAPDVQGQPVRPVPGPFGLPAGAVLVAAQNTSVSARTDETGRFTLSGLPAGQYLTIAAGPVASSNAAVAERPNVLVSGGETMDIGTLSLGGGPTPLGIACRIPFDVPNATGEATPPVEPMTPEAPSTP